MHRQATAIREAIKKWGVIAIIIWIFNAIVPKWCKMVANINVIWIEEIYQICCGIICSHKIIVILFCHNHIVKIVTFLLLQNI